jgi:putative ABC transport system permease protein
MTNTWPSTIPKTSASIFSFLTKNDDVENQLTFPLIVGRDMQQAFPEIKSVTRFQDEGEELVRVNKEGYKEKHVIYADDNFFKNFSFPVIKGDAKTVLESLNNVVISESTAKKYFGTTDALGKTIELIGDSSRLFTVAAIAKDAPANSSIQYSVVVPLKASPDYNNNIKGGFNQSSHILIAELADNISAPNFEIIKIWT